MASPADAGNFNASLGCLYSSGMDGLATQLAQIAGLDANERDAILAAVRESLCATLHARLSRVLVLELNAARVSGRLQGGEAAQRWEEFLALSSGRDFWSSLVEHYPNLLARVDSIVRNRCAAAWQFAQRWAADRASLSCLCGGEPGQLLEVSFGAGDSHRSGQTVAVLRCEAGRMVYKPRSLAVDATLARFIEGLADDHSTPLTIRVPRVVDREDHGWTEFVGHRHAADDDELLGFYRGIGHWLAIMRLLGGSDLHAENLIAHGASPVVIDCETLFTPKVPPSPSGFGQAPDRAAELVAGTVLSIGMLPGRGAGLGWRGVDTSAVGSLPGQQPMLPQPDILNAGTDEAYVGTTMVEARAAQNHPSPQPALSRYWPEVIAAFDAMTATLRRLDDAGSLLARLEPFADCRIRVVTRATEVYAELARMLWHPVSLHNEQNARGRAHDLLARMAANVSIAPGDPAVIDAEIADLLEGDIPFFATTPGSGRLEGPRGTCWRPQTNLILAALDHWRAADLRLERHVIQAALISAYINQGWMPEEVSLWPAHAKHGNLELRRRTEAARIVRELAATAIHGDDGSVAWIAPVFDPVTGWSVQPLAQDLYGGTSGIALLIAAYLRESRAGRADRIEGLDELLAAALVTLDLAEAKCESQRRDSIKVRPLPPGGYVGLGSLIWTRLVLASWGMDRGDGCARACALADSMPDAAAAAEMNDVLSGIAGAIPPLLLLARQTGDANYLQMACELGDRLCAQAVHDGDRAYWVHEHWPKGVGGFAHGVTGIGWALTRLARATGESRYGETARAAFAFEDALFDHQEQNWLDLRMLPGAKTAAAWCHGAVGIGLAHLDLDPQLQHPATRELLRRAAAATWRQGLGWNHSACHGDASAWQLLDAAIAAGEGPRDLTREDLLEHLLTSIEEHGAVCGMVRDTFSPGLLSGAGGIAYQLLKAHPQSRLPSMLTPGGDAP